MLNILHTSFRTNVSPASKLILLKFRTNIIRPSGLISTLLSAAFEQNISQYFRTNLHAYRYFLRSFCFGQFLGKHSNKCLSWLSNIYIVELSNKIFDQKLLHLTCQFFYRSSFPFPGLDSCQTFGSRHTQQKNEQKVFERNILSQYFRVSSHTL